MNKGANARGQPLDELAALRHSEEQYRRLLDERGEGYVIVLSERIVLANPPLAQMTGYAVEEMIGRLFTSPL